MLGLFSDFNESTDQFWEILHLNSIQPVNPLSNSELQKTSSDYKEHAQKNSELRA